MFSIKSLPNSDSHDEFFNMKTCYNYLSAKPGDQLLAPFDDDLSFLYEAKTSPTKSNDELNLDFDALSKMMNLSSDSEDFDLLKSTGSISLSKENSINEAITVPDSNSTVSCDKPDQKVYQTITNFIKGVSKSDTVRLGRPKYEYEITEAKLESFFEIYVNELQEIIKSNFNKKRSDTFRNTIFSYLKKLPLKLREISCSVSESKSFRLMTFLNAFLIPFVNCF